jgi:arsenate reductase-like glutaredoxin family protein
MEVELRDLSKERLTVPELDRLTRGRDYREFLNPRNELYRKRNMKERPPSRAEALELMAREPNLIRRPVVIWDQQIILGYDERKLAALG